MKPLMDIYSLIIRYFDDNERRIISAYFDLVDLFQGEVEKATAKVIFEAVENAFSRRSIELTNVIGLVRKMPRYLCFKMCQSLAA